jgi:putative flippase GtrA
MDIKTEIVIINIFSGTLLAFITSVLTGVVINFLMNRAWTPEHYGIIITISLLGSIVGFCMGLSHPQVQGNTK